jgi:nucleotide-binding universal stress UspA family protein
MTTPTVAAPIVVGVDTQNIASDAVCWAAAEAAVRQCPLRLAHAFHPPTLINPYDAPTAGYEFILARQAAEQALREAAALARRIAPEIALSVRLSFGAPKPVLLAESVTAGLLVVGDHGLSRARRPLTGSVAEHVAARAGCPTVVIHSRDPRSPAIPPPRPHPPRVVVGVDTTPWCASAIEFAFQAAHQRGIHLIAIHACPPKSLPGLREADAFNGVAPHDDSPGEGLDGTGVETKTVQATPPIPPSIRWSIDDLDQELVVEHAVDYWRTHYPDVTVVIKVVHDDPARALLNQSVGAALLVVGSRGHGRLRRLLRASVSHVVLRSANSPVAVVGHRYTPPHRDEPQPSTSAPAHHLLRHHERS